MSAARPSHLAIRPGLRRRWLLAACLLSAGALPAWPQPAAVAVLDKVVAVVNNQVILASDIDRELRLSVLDPGQVGQKALSRRRALDQLIARALIQRQIRRDDEQAAMPSQAAVQARIAELRKELPACMHRQCASDSGWEAFLAAHGLTSEGVESYMRYRLEILDFIELRFRQGIRISPQEIDAYYRETLLPQYAPGDAVPSLDDVSQRIEEILLEKQVNVLFDQWLANLRDQGDVEILDPALAQDEAALQTPPEVRNP